MKNYIVNAFSLNMLSCDYADITVRRQSRDQITASIKQDIAEGNVPQSFLGHADLIGLAKKDLAEVADLLVENRKSLTLDKDGGHLYVIQYVGPRLPEGCKELPSGARIDYFGVTVRP